MRQLFYYKMRQKFVAKYIPFFIMKCVVFITNAAVITKCDKFITKCDSHNTIITKCVGTSHQA